MQCEPNRSILSPALHLPALTLSAPQIYLALLALGVKHGDKVITNGFTFTALPSTIIHAGASPVLVEANENFTMNVEDLKLKIAANPDCKVMILSHFRGKLSDCDAIRDICDEHGILMVEDCAHGMGCTWNGEQAGKVGDIAVFSCQSDKVVNAGEGGFLATNNAEWASQCVYWSGACESRQPRLPGLYSTLFQRNSLKALMRRRGTL